MSYSQTKLRRLRVTKINQRCIVEGCGNDIEIESEEIVKDFRYVCSGRRSYGDKILVHSRKEQLEALGRKYDPRTDEDDQLVHFQSTQFDKDIDNRAGPVQSLEGDDTSDSLIEPIQGVR